MVPLDHFSLSFAVIRFRSIYVVTLLEYIALLKSVAVEVARWEVSASHVTREFFVNSTAHCLGMLPDELGEVTYFATVALVSAVVVVLFFFVPIFYS